MEIYYFVSYLKNKTKLNRWRKNEEKGKCLDCALGDINYSRLENQYRDLKTKKANKNTELSLNILKQKH